MKNKFLNDIYSFCNLNNLDTLNEEIEKIVEGYEVIDIVNNGNLIYSLQDKNNNKIILTAAKNGLTIKKDLGNKDFSNFSEYIFIDSSKLILTKKVVESHSDGLVYCVIKKHFTKNHIFNMECVLDGLIEQRYTLKTETLNELKENVDLKTFCNYYTEFSTFMNKFMRMESTPRLTKDNKYSTRTYLNNEDISSIYDIVDGPDKLYRVYDLYNGKINERNERDIIAINYGFLSPDAFDYKGLRGITEKENNLIGIDLSENQTDYVNYLTKLFDDKFGYKGQINLDRESLLRGITYKLSSSELAKRQIEIKLGIPYEEYIKLDIDERYKLIKQKTGKKVKPDYRLYVDGIPMDDEHIITKDKIDKKIDKLTESSSKRLFKRIFQKK